MSANIFHGAMKIQDSSIKYELELHGAMPMQDSSLKDELVLKRSSSKIQDSSLKYELVLRRSPSKFIDGHCNISWICVCCVLINASLLMTMCFFQLYTKCAPTTPCKAQLGELHIYKKW